MGSVSNNTSISVPARALSILATFVTAGFIAWAGVVWDTGREITDLVSDMRGDLRELRVMWTEHRQSPIGHSGTGEHIRKSEQLMAVTRSRLERLERDHENLRLKNEQGYDHGAQRR